MSRIIAIFCLLMLTHQISTAQGNSEVMLVSQAEYSCFKWVMNGMTFTETMDTLRKVSISGNMTRRLLRLAEGKMEYRSVLTDNDLGYGQAVMNMILNDVRNILFISTPINLRVIKDGTLSPTTNCNKKLITIDVSLLKKLLYRSVERAAENEAKINGSINLNGDVEANRDIFFSLWSDEFISETENKPIEQQRHVAIKLNRMSYFVFSEFYRFFLFVLGHETYHLITKCKQTGSGSKTEENADLLGAALFQFLYKHLDYDEQAIWTCLTGTVAQDNPGTSYVLGFLFGREIEEIYDFLYQDTEYRHGNPSRLDLEERKKYIYRTINEMDINKIYKKYEKSIKKFSKN